MGVLIVKKAPTGLVGPTAQDIILSCNDVMEDFPLAMMYIFNSGENMKFSLLCDSLQKTLQYYPALCGRLRKNLTGTFDIECNGKGVQIIEATTEAKLSDLDLNCLHLLPTDIYTNVEA